MDPITAAVTGWSWWIWLSIGLVAVAAIIVGVVHYRTHRNAVKALQAGIEFFIGKLAAKGMPIEANELGKTIGESVTKAGSLVQKLNDKLHEQTKVKVAADLLEGKNTRELIAKAFEKERLPQPDASGDR